MYRDNSVLSKSINVVILILCFTLLINIFGHPNPDKFDQPLKYKLLSVGSEFLNRVGLFMEYFNICTRLDITRFAYHWTIGAFNIRDPADFIQVIDEAVEHVSMRIYRPLNHSEDLISTIIFYHGGGHFVGSADIVEPLTYQLAKFTNFQVIYIEFRLIPEHKFPSALSDSMLVTKYLINNNINYKIDLKNLILMGDSAGGNLAAVISQTLISENFFRPKLQVLIYPMLQLFDFSLPSYRINMPKRILGTIHAENFKNFLHYLTGIPVDDTIFLNGHTSSHQKESLSKYVNTDYLPTNLTSHNLDNLSLINDTNGRYTELTKIILNKDCSPLLVDDEFLYKNTPANTFLLTAELDILRDDGFIYAERLRRLGLNIEHKHHTDTFHGILNILNGPFTFKQGETFLKEISASIKIILQN